jgi:5-methylthioadenosine/S-adenosylhomocysteine deaminase
MAAETSYLLRGGVLIAPADGEKQLRGDLPGDLPGDLLIEGGRITALGSVRPPPGVPVIDCTGCAVMPGLVQAHVHLCQTLCRGRADDLALLDWLHQRVLPYEAALDEDDLTLAAELGCAELLLSGTTAILDMGTVHHEDALCDAVARSGLRATVGKAMMDSGDGVPAALREATHDSLYRSDALQRRWHGAASGRLRYAYAPRFVLSCTDALLRGVAERVAADPAAGLRIHTHAAEQLDEVALVQARYGTGNVAALESLGLCGPQVVLAHCVHVGDGERQLLARAGTHVAHCPASNLKLGSGIAQVVELLAAGVNVAIGCDGAPCNNRLDGFAELRLCALLQKGRRGPAALPAAQALELATMGGARALGLEAEIGSLAVGKRADVTVVDLTSLAALPAHSPISAIVYAVAAADVRHVFVDGRWLVERGALRPETGLDVERLRAVSNERVPKLLRRAGLA